jgi:acyl carrier protein
MTDTEIIQKINEAIAQEFELEVADLKPETHLITDLELDSLDFVDLIVVLQNTVGIKLRDDEEVRSIRTLGDVHRLVITRLSQSASA